MTPLSTPASTASGTLVIADLKVVKSGRSGNRCSSRVLPRLPFDHFVRPGALSRCLKGLRAAWWIRARAVRFSPRATQLLCHRFSNWRISTIFEPSLTASRTLKITWLHTAPENNHLDCSIYRKSQPFDDLNHLNTGDNSSLACEKRQPFGNERPLAHNGL